MAASNDPSPPQSDHAADPELERTLLSPGVGRSDAPRLVIEVLSGGRRGLVKECFEEDLSLGRRPGNTLSFDGREDRAVSGKHLRLQLHEGTWWAEDLSSTNGTLLNDAVLREARSLQSGDVLELGRRPEMGTGGTVKLRLTMERSPTATDADDGEGFVPTRLHEDDTPSTKSDADPQPTPAPPIPDLPSSVRERLATLQTRTLDLGKLTYRLEEQLATLAQQAVDASEVDLAALPGGPELLASQAAQACWATEYAAARSALEGHVAAADAELQSLEECCQKSRASLGSSQAAGAEARARAEQAAQQESSLQAETREALAPLLADLNGALAGAAFPKEASVAAWIAALQQAATELGSRSAALSDNATEALAAAEQALASFAAVDSATQAESEATTERQAAEARQAEALRQLAEGLERLQSQPQAEPDHAQAQLTAFATRNLQSSPSGLAQLPAFDQASRLEQKRADLAAEIKLLQAQLH